MAIGDRIRAARCYADLSQTELAEQLGVEKQFILRREDGRQDPKKQELIAIAAVTGAPLEFLEHGWSESIARTPAEHQRLDRLEAQIDRVLAIVEGTRDFARQFQDAISGGEELVKAAQEAAALDPSQKQGPQQTRRNA